MGADGGGVHESVHKNAHKKVWRDVNAWFSTVTLPQQASEFHGKRILSGSLGRWNAENTCTQIYTQYELVVPVTRQGSAAGIRAHPKGAAGMRAHTRSAYVIYLMDSATLLNMADRSVIFRDRQSQHTVPNWQHQGAHFTFVSVLPHLTQEALE